MWANNALKVRARSSPVPLAGLLVRNRHHPTSLICLWLGVPESLSQRRRDFLLIDHNELDSQITLSVEGQSRER